MKILAEVGEQEKVDNLTLASAIKNFCFNTDCLDPVKVAKAILIDLEEE